MKTTRQFILAIAISTLLGASSRTQALETPQTANQKTSNAAAPETNYSGTVTVADGKPVSGATVEYWRYEGPLHRLEVAKKIATGADGAFAFHVSRGMGFLLARKPGWAPAWRQLGQPFNPVRKTGVRLVLSAPTTLVGVVMDESNQPVANAEVFVSIVASEVSRTGGGQMFNYLSGQAARDCFAARTDATGHFRIKDFPTDATAALAVQSPGMALRQSLEQTVSFDSLPWSAGQQDIKLVVEPAGRIEGKIVVGETNQPVPMARLFLQPNAPSFPATTEMKPAQSQANGSFHINDVAAGSYRLRAIFGTNAVPDWVAEPVPVSVESGQITRGVKIKPIRGGLLKVTVLSQSSNEPLEHVNVNAFKEDFQAAAVSDRHGVALLRLLPGDYQVMASRNYVASGQIQASVVAAQTDQIEIQLPSPQKITGIVRKPDGQRAAGLAVRLIGAYGPEAARIKTDASGKFDLELNPRVFGQYNATPCLLVRDAKHNLAVAQEVDEDTTNVILKLAPGLTLIGRAECNGKPVTNATATLVFWSGRSGMWLRDLARTNAPGQYEIPALPPDRKYGVIVSAPGYGQQQLMNLDISAEAGRQKLETVELKPARLKLSGQVLDANDQPVAGCFVNLQGQGQPNAHVRTDSEGRFTFAHVCAGTARLFANQNRSFGSISAEGGDTNVVLRLGQNYSSSPGATMHKLQGMVTDADGKPVAGAQVRVFPDNGRRWFRTESTGAYHLTWSVQPWQASSGDALLVVRAAARNLAGSAYLSADTTNLNVRLKPALTLSGRVESVGGDPLAGAQIGVWVKACNTYEQLDERLTTADGQGRYEIKCLPPDAPYMVFAQARDHGRHERQIQNDTETNRMELEPFVLKLANRILAGRVLDENGKPASGVNVNLSGEGQPSGNTVTDYKGRFHFRVCEGTIRLFANAQGAFAQTSAEAGDTNVVMTLGTQSGNFFRTRRRVSLKGRPLPDLTTVNLAADAAPAGEPVLLCLFNAGERPSRHVIHLLSEQAVALRQKNICVLGVQAAVISDEIFNEWKSDAPVSFPIGRVTVKSSKNRWARDTAALPWLIVTDANHRVIAEGFSFDNLDAQIQKMLKKKG